MKIGRMLRRTIAIPARAMVLMPPHRMPHFGWLSALHQRGHPAPGAGPGSSRLKPTGAPLKRVSALTGHDPLSGGTPRSEHASCGWRGISGRRIPPPSATCLAAPASLAALRLWNHAHVRMMSALWANDLIAPCAVSQGLGVADLSGGVAGKGELPAELAMLLFVCSRLNKNTGPDGPTVSTAKAAEPPSFMLPPPAMSAP